MAGQLVYADVCKNCGENIHYRNKVQGWLHPNEERACRPRYAQPSHARWAIED